MSRRAKRRPNAPQRQIPERRRSATPRKRSTLPEAREDSQPEKIADIPALKEQVPVVLLSAEAINAFVQLLKGEGVDHQVLDELLLGTEEVLAYGRIGELADEFNAVFAEHGWIATESMSAKVLQSALRRHKTGGLRSSEPTIMSWFYSDTLQRFAVDRYESFEKSKPRTRQLKEALQLTMEKRYESAVPLILIACEGFARDFLHTELFKSEVELSLDDSFVGHKTALPEFIHHFTLKVKETSNDTTVDPSRHGIMHGLTLSYANSTVCTKASLLFIALTDLYIEKEEQKKTASEALETIPEPTMEALVKSFLDAGRKLARKRQVERKQMYLRPLDYANMRSR